MLARLKYGALTAATAALLTACPTPPEEVSTDFSTTTSSDNSTGPVAEDSTGDDSTSGPVCGDGAVEGDEECDLGDDLNGTGDFCRADCRNNVCGDGYVGPGEACDDGNSDNNDDCTNTCGPAGCGNGMPDLGEECDEGKNNSNTGACLLSCQLAECGDSFIQTGVEICDNRDIGAETCESQGFADGGTLLCNGDCTGFNTANCHECGNGMIEPTEDCEGADLNEVTCDDYAVGKEMGNGELACDAACQFDNSACTFCGDGTIEGDEDCEAGDLGGATCSSINPDFDGGDVTCNTNCTFNTIDCTQCGNNLIEGGEFCDGTNVSINTCATVLGSDDYLDEASILGCEEDCSAHNIDNCCLTLNADCTNNDECCTGHCDTGTSNECFCLAVSEACEDDVECCSGTCMSSTCL